MKFYKTEQESRENYKNHNGPIEEINDGYLHFESDDEYIQWLKEYDAMPLELPCDHINESVNYFMTKAVRK